MSGDVLQGYSVSVKCSFKERQSAAQRGWMRGGAEEHSSGHPTPAAHIKHVEAEGCAVTSDPTTKHSVFISFHFISVEGYHPG